MQPTTYPNESSIILYLVVYVLNGYMWMQRFVFVFCHLWVELCKMWGDGCIFMILLDVFINPPAREPHTWDPLYKSPVHLYMRALLRLHKYYRRFSMLTSKESCWSSLPAQWRRCICTWKSQQALTDRHRHGRIYFCPYSDFISPKLTLFLIRLGRIV